MNLSFNLFLSAIAAAATLIPLSGLYGQYQLKNNASNNARTAYHRGPDFTTGPFVVDDGSVFDDLESAHRHLQSRIIGGSRIPEGRYPYMTTVIRLERREDDRLYFVGDCSGFLIHPNAVMTAATCVGNRSETYGYAVVFNVTKGSDPPDGYRVGTAIFTHPDFDNQTKYPNTVVPQDFALLYLGTTEGIQPLAISTDTPPVGSVFTAIGLGRNDTNSSLDFPNSDRLIDEVDMTRIDVGTCQDIALSLCEFPEESIELNADIQMCAQGNPGTGTCFDGDRGGPLIVTGEDASEDVAYGLSSFTYFNDSTTEPVEDCGKYPSGYSRINQDVIDWTERVICFFTDPIRSGTPAENIKNRPASCPPLRTLAPATAAPVTTAPDPNPTVSPDTVAPASAPVVAPPAGGSSSDSSSSDDNSGKSKKMMSGKSGKKGAKKSNRAKVTTELLRGGW